MYYILFYIYIIYIYNINNIYIYTHIDIYKPILVLTNFVKDKKTLLLITF